MAEITAASVGKLREMTGAGLMDCKKALTEAKGDLGAAGDILRKRGVATAVSKAGREAREGVIAQHIAPGGRLGVLVEINCETDFVARNETFRGFADEVARRLAADGLATFDAEVHGLVAKIRENIKVARHARMRVTGNGLVDQGFVKKNSEISVKEHVGQIAKQLGDEITIRRFVRFQVGEGAGA